MKLKYILFLALRNLFGHRMRTVLTASGVAISVGFVVFLVSLGLGLEKVSTSQIANLDALQIIDITAPKSKIINVNDESLDKIKGIGGVKNVEPEVGVASKITYKSSDIDGVVYGKNYDFLKLEEPKLSSGRIYTENTSNEILLSSAAQSQLGSNASVGDNIKIESYVPASLIKDGKNKKVVFEGKIVGVLEDNSAPFVYLPLEFFVKEGLVNYSGAKAKVESKDSVDKIKPQIESLGFKTSSIKDTVDQINQFFSIFQIILVVFGAIAIIVACLGMFNTLTITLLEKTREVGFMKALGTRNKDVYRLFIAESLLIGILGSFVGILAGIVLGQSLNATIVAMAKVSGNTAVKIFYTPIYLVILVILIAVLISFLTGLYPSRRAARISPLDALRYE